uniref:Uncharacterized protein n=1 Tax=Hordeum vulgare subsp. vulgare TaxID=112509 RepID=A0A8I6YNA4_HORVV
MPKAGKRRRRVNPETETAARKKEKKTTMRSLAEDRSLTFAAFQSEKAKPQAKLDPVYDDVDSSDEESSSCPPSPLLHRPYILNELADNPDIRAAFHLANTEYHADRACRSAVLDCYSSASCLSNNPSLLHIREPAKDAVLLAADSIITLSSYLDADDDEPFNTCCGLWIQHDIKKKTAVVLTSAHLIRAKDPSVRHQWMLRSTCEYHREAEVIVHLLDGETAVASLLYLQEHYEFALYEGGV